MDDIARALSALSALDPECVREHWVRIGMAAKAAGLSKDDFVSWSSGAANYSDERSCVEVWRSISDGPVKAATLFSMAFSEGWNDPAKKGHNAHRSHKAVTEAPRPRFPRAIPAETDKSASSCWARYSPATGEHAYIIAKRGMPDGLRIVGARDTTMVAGQTVVGWLVVPAFSLDGKLHTLQFIPPPGIGKKLNLPGASFGDGLFVVGNMAESAGVYVVEGIGQAWAIHRVAGWAAVVAFGAGRMATVAQAVRERYPSRTLVVVPDRGKENQAAVIARTVGGTWIELPENTPSNYDANDFAAEYGDKALAELLARSKTPPMRYRLLSSDEVANFPPLRWMVLGVLPAIGLTALFGPSASGKSFLVLDLCAAVAGGSDEWFSCRVKSVPVVYLALEGEAGFSQRVTAWQLSHSRKLPSALHFIMQPLDLRNDNDVTEISEAVVAAGAAGGLLVIDTLNRAASGADENSVVDMGEIIAAAKRLQSKLGGMVLLVHHSGKDVSRGLRGHSSLHAALDCAIEVSRADDRREWRIAKAKDGDDGETHPFRLQVVEVGADDDGEPVTSCVVKPDDQKATFRRVLPPKSGNMRVIWDALGELLRQAGDARPAGAPDRLPFGRPTVTLNAAIEGTRERLDCDAKRRTERAQQALIGLQSKGLIVIDGDYVWAV